MELVEIKNNAIQVNSNTISKIKNFNKIKLQMDLLEQQLKEEIKTAMKEIGVTSFTADGIYASITQVKGRETVDTKKLKEDLPEIVAQYTKVGSPTERFTLKIDD